MLLLMVLFSCTSEPVQTGWHQSANGLRYKLHHSAGDTARARPGMYVLADLRYGTPDTLFLDTWSSGKMAPLRMRDSQYPGDLFEGLALVGEGDSVTFRLLADSFFIRTTGMVMLPPSVAPGDSIDILMVIRDIRSSREHRIELARQIQGMRGIPSAMDTLH